MKKSEVRELLLRIYEEASSDYKVIGSQKIQLMSSSIFGLGFLITFATLFYYLSKDNILTDFRAIWFTVILIFLTLLLFTGIAWYFLFLHKIQRIHWVTTALLEKLLKELISGEKNEGQILSELRELVPQFRLAVKFNVTEKRWFKNSLETEKEKELMEYLS